MNRQHQPHNRSSRSNAYSESKCSNWMRFDPYQGELSSLPPNLKPTASYPINDDHKCRIYQRPVNHAFLRPYDADDVIQTLKLLPQEFLADLDAIYLMGGNRKQDQVAWSNLSRFGTYCWKDIYLWAFPRCMLKCYYKGTPKPVFKQEYERAGATFEENNTGYTCHFNEDCLKTFYLGNVLIHEIGHHVDRHNFDRKTYDEEERYAEWFAREYGFGRKE